ncbi:MAG: ATP-binding cassette domain-containing protein [Alphaproteobacteria bacterium]|nr:ATP-binding cassette domain-containing protein [Alphaproteobacteria bacterium]
MKNQSLNLESVSHRFGNLLAVDDVTLSVEPGEIVCLVGPSGCGKSTLLRIAAGLEPLQQGRVSIGSEIMADGSLTVPPEQRNVGLVFQDYALFPHLSVRDNIAFGLRDVTSAEKRERTELALERTGLQRWADTFPHELSGGQQQRVALARAIAPRPRVVLLDEPFSGLDAELRHQVRDGAAAILRETGVATLMVTHDSEEAMYIADRIAVMREGSLRQIGPPDDIYLQPTDAFVAAFFGDVNRFRGLVSMAGVETPLGRVDTNGFADGTEVEVLMRPEAVVLSDTEGTVATVKNARFLGRTSLIDVTIGDGEAIAVRIRVAGRQLPAAGTRVFVRRSGDQAFIFAPGTPK